MADRYGLTTITTELDDGVLVVTLNRPERRNALDTVMHSELPHLYQNARRRRRGAGDDPHRRRRLLHASAPTSR